VKYDIYDYFAFIITIALLLLKSTDYLTFKNVAGALGVVGTLVH